MKTVRLSKEELIYLAALSGLDNVWGIEDPFSDMSESMVQAKILELQAKLSTEGILHIDEEGVLTVSEEYSDILEKCMNAVRIYVLNSSEFEQEKVQLRFFQTGETLLRFQLRDEAVIEPSAFALMEAEIMNFFSSDAETEDSCSLVASISRLRRMGSLSRKHFLQELKYCGCENDLALLIAEGLQGESVFCSLLVYDRSGKEDRLSGKLVTLNFAGGSLMVTPGSSDPDTVQFTRLDRGRMQAELNRILENKGNEEPI